MHMKRTSDKQNWTFYKITGIRPSKVSRSWKSRKKHASVADWRWLRRHDNYMQYVILFSIKIIIGTIGKTWMGSKDWIVVMCQCQVDFLILMLYDSYIKQCPCLQQIQTKVFVMMGHRISNFLSNGEEKQSFFCNSAVRNYYIC